MSDWDDILAKARAAEARVNALVGPEVVALAGELEKLREERLALRLFLRIAENALDSIASWKEGAEVDDHFDEPSSARKARRALTSIRQLRGDNDRAELAKGKAAR